MDTTIDEIRAGWEQLREQVKALQLTAQFYAERNQQQIAEKEKLIDERDKLKLDFIARAGDLHRKIDTLDELLWWLTANNHRHDPEYNYRSWSTIWDILIDERRMLAAQGYTRENLESRSRQ